MPYSAEDIEKFREELPIGDRFLVKRHKDEPPKTMRVISKYKHFAVLKDNDGEWEVGLQYPRLMQAKSENKVIKL